jgi:malate dehydrogenase (oxaloacetate-decarboxylating)(NADP+)
MMVNEGEADALVTGHSRSYPSVVKPIQHSLKSAWSLDCCHYKHDDDGSWANVLSDTAININPSADDLAKIAIMTAKRLKCLV